MSVEKVVRDRLVSAGVASGRVYQLTLPQKPVLPAVRVQLVDQPVRYHLRGKDGLYRSVIQTDVFVTEGSGYSACATLADAIDASLSGSVFSDGGSPQELSVVAVFRESRRPMFEAGELRLIRIMQDYEVWHRMV